MQLSNINIVGLKGLKHIHIVGERIGSIANEEKLVSLNVNEYHLFLETAIAFPGLINSHDHLDFNLFPQLGNRIYNSYTEWGIDIHQCNKKIIDQILKIPRHFHIRWGIYKNLLNGITTVVNHGTKLKVQEDLISIYQKARSFHSISGEKGLLLKLINPFKKAQPIVIHIGEGTDAFSAREIDHLTKWNIFRKEIIGVHGVAMNEKQAPFFKALVWCPDSNYFLLGRTAAIDQLKSKVKIIFGTDSTLTASWNLWEQLRLARASRMITDAELFASLTSTAADLWQLQGIGSIAENQRADIVIVRKKNGLEGWDAFYASNPEDILLVIHKGNIRLFDDQLHRQLVNLNFPLNDFYKIEINGNYKYIQGNLPGLINEIRKYDTGINFPVSI